jgi:hypothetical protein
MIDLTPEQRQALNERHEFPPRVRDPYTQEIFVLLHAEMYERVRALLEEEDEMDVVREMYPLVGKALDKGEADVSEGGG